MKGCVIINMTINALESWYNFDILLGTYSISSDIDIAEESISTIKNFGKWMKDKVIELWNKFKIAVKEILTKIQSKLKGEKQKKQKVEIKEVSKSDELLKELKDMYDSIEILSQKFGDRVFAFNVAVGRGDDNFDKYTHRIIDNDTPDAECKKYIDIYNKAYERIRDLKTRVDVSVFETNKNKIIKIINDIKFLYSGLEMNKNCVINIAKALELNPERNSTTIQVARTILADFAALQKYILQAINILSSL